MLNIYFCRTYPDKFILRSMKSEGCHSNFIFVEINTGKTSCAVFGDIYRDQSDQMSTLVIRKHLQGVPKVILKPSKDFNKEDFFLGHSV